MLKKFAAALLACSLIAAPALAAQSDASNAPAAAQTAPAKMAPSVKHAKSHGHRHVSRSKTTHHARHDKPAKAHQANAKSAQKS